MGESSCFLTSLNSDSYSENACTLEAISKVRERLSREKGGGLQKNSVNIQISASFKFVTHISQEVDRKVIRHNLSDTV